MKNKRLGNDPLSWIGREPIKAAEDLAKEKSEKVLATTSKEAALKEAKPAKDGKFYVKKTADIREDLIEKIHDVAYWDRIKIRDAWEKVIEFYFEQNKVKPRLKQD
jgi:hypothetical protein